MNMVGDRFRLGVRAARGRRRRAVFEPVGIRIETSGGAERLRADLRGAAGRSASVRVDVERSTVRIEPRGFSWRNGGSIHHAAFEGHLIETERGATIIGDVAWRGSYLAQLGLGVAFILLAVVLALAAVRDPAGVVLLIGLGLVAIAGFGWQWWAASRQLVADAAIVRQFVEGVARADGGGRDSR
jgi:hypothetical protein